MPRKLRFSKIKELDANKTDLFLSDQDGTVNAGGDYTTQYLGYYDPAYRSEGNCVIERLITKNSSGDVDTHMYAPDSDGDQMIFNKIWSKRKDGTYTYKNLKL